MATIINTIEDLDNIRNDLLADYVLARNLDFNDDASYANPANKTTYTTGAGWVPIGTGLDSFDGNFDGKGYVIRNLFINRPTTNNVGLFDMYEGIVGEGVITALGLVDVNVTGQDEVGALVGYAYQCTVTNCYSTGTVTGRKDVGGLIGYYESGDVMRDCYSRCTVTATGDLVGGLVGYYYSPGCPLEDSYATGDVTGNGAVGGLVGGADAVKINRCYATGNVTGGVVDDWDIGGLAGYISDNSCSNSYSTGNVSGQYQVGGFVGAVYLGGQTITGCYSTGAVSGVTTVGGFAGYVSYSESIVDCFWDTQTSGKSTSGGLDVGHYGDVGKTTTQMKTLSTYTTVTGVADSQVNLVQNASTIAGQIHGGTAGSGQSFQQRAQSFVAAYSSIRQVSIYTSKTGTITDGLTLTIRSSLGGTVLASKTYLAGGLAFSGYKTFVFDTPLTVTIGATYFIQVERTGAVDTVNYVSWWYATTNPYSGGTRRLRANNVWSELAGDDHDFTVYYSGNGSPGLLTPWSIATRANHTSETWYIQDGSYYPRLSFQKPQPAGNMLAMF